MLKGTLRAFHMGLEKQTGARLPATHPLFVWMVRHASYTRIARIRGTDVLTAYQRIRGRALSGLKLIGFGEICKFKKKVPREVDGRVEPAVNNLDLDGHRVQDGTVHLVGRRAGTARADDCATRRQPEVKLRAIG